MPRKERVLTEDEIGQVRRLAPYLTQAQLADFLRISQRTFNNIRERQPEVNATYQEARAEIIGKVAESLVQDALDGCTTSRIFFLKTQGGWRETNVHEHTGKDGGPIQTEEVTARDRIACRLSRLAAAGSAEGDTGGTK